MHAGTALLGLPSAFLAFEVFFGFFPKKKYKKQREEDRLVLDINIPDARYRHPLLWVWCNIIFGNVTQTSPDNQNRPNNGAFAHAA
jgi:hypothetical protein